MEPHPEGLYELDNNGRVTLFVRRALDTEDFLMDFVFPLDEEFDIGYAFNDYTNDLSPYTPHTIHGNTTVTLKSDGSWAFGDNSASFDSVGEVSSAETM